MKVRRSLAVTVASAAVVVLALLVGSSTALGGSGSQRSGNPNGQWVTVKAVQAVILSNGIEVDECMGGACKITNGKLVGGPPTSGRVAKVVSAAVTGIGPYNLINGARRYQLFNVQACTIYYYRGAHRWGVQVRWFTRRPPGGTMTTSDRNGGVTVERDSGEPYARDWNYPFFAPLARDHC